MADSTLEYEITSDGIKQKLDTEKLTVGSETTHRQRIQLAGRTATAIAEVKNSAMTGTEAGLATRIVPESYSAKAVDATIAGDNTIHTPAAGKAVRLHYISLSANGANTADVTVIVKFGAAGSGLYKLSLKAGVIWARNIGAGRRYIQGAVDAPLIVNLSAAQTVFVSIEYEEI